MALHVLVAEDAPDVAHVVAFGARMTWPDCRVTVAADGAAALRLFAADPADLVILDVEMPPPDGIEVCRRIRSSSAVPILMLTVRDAVADKVRALDFGADDYLAKPFDHLELLARMRALVRRASTGRALPSAVLTVGEVTLDTRLQSVSVRGAPVRLTTTEFRLLEALLRNAGEVQSHRALCEELWGADSLRDAAHLKVFVRRLRAKLGDDADQPRYILTEWGAGYRFVRPD